MPVTVEQITTALRRVNDPELHKDIITLNMVKDVRVTSEGAVTLALQLRTAGSGQALVGLIESSLRAIGATNVRVDVQGGGVAPAHGATTAPGGALPQVARVIAVGAGKGGVGKSTIAVNLAVGLARTGARVGLMDGDIYGPSMPAMLGLKGVPPEVRGSHILPHRVHGIHAITIGSLVEADKPLIWRGPMAHGAFKQLLLDNTDWPPLDWLVVDLPPGTGDVPLTLCQLLPLTGAVLVATPQQVALDDAIRAARMFQQLGAPILGVVENMSYFIAPDGSESDIFGRGGAERAAQELGVPFLGALPMFTELRVNSDAGEPHRNFEHNPLLRQSLETLVKNLQAQVSMRLAQSKTPVLNIS